MVLPEFNETVFRSKRTKYCLLIPNFNEKKNLDSQITKMRNHGVFDLVDTVICDAGSTDGSADPEALQKAGFRALLVRHGNGRYSRATMALLRWIATTRMILPLCPISSPSWTRDMTTYRVPDLFRADTMKTRRLSGFGPSR